MLLGRKRLFSWLKGVGKAWGKNLFWFCSSTCDLTAHKLDGLLLLLALRLRTIGGAGSSSKEGSPVSKHGSWTSVYKWGRVGRIWAVFGPSGQLYLCNKFCDEQKNPQEKKGGVPRTLAHLRFLQGRERYSLNLGHHLGQKNKDKIQA